MITAPLLSMIVLPAAYYLVYRPRRGGARVALKTVRPIPAGGGENR